MATVNLIQIAKDFGLLMEVTTYPLVKNSKPVVKMWLDTHADPVLTAVDEPNTYIHVAWGVTKKLVNGYPNFFYETLIYNDNANDQWVRDQLTKVIDRYKKRLAKLKGNNNGNN